MSTDHQTATQQSSTSTVVPCQFCGASVKVDLARAAHRPRCGSCGKPILLDRPIKATEEQFQATVLNANVPVLVDFYADWCAPCRQIAPLVDDIAREQMGKLLVVKIDVDRAPGLAEQYGIRGIPFLARFERGNLVKSVVGGVGREGLQNLVP